MNPLRRRMPHVFGHGSTIEIGQRGRTCTCAPSVPGRVCWLLHYALKSCPGVVERRAGDLAFGETDLQPPCSLESVVRFGGSEGARTLSLPADNGLLR